MRICVKVSPRSAKNEVVKIAAGEYKVKIAAPPVDGQANELLVAVVADYFGVPKSAVRIVSGKTAKLKLIEILP